MWITFSLLFKPLTTVGYLLEAFIRLWIPSLACISTSVNGVCSFKPYLCSIVFLELASSSSKYKTLKISGSCQHTTYILGKMHRFSGEQKTEQADRVGSLEDENYNVTQVSSEAIQL